MKKLLLFLAVALTFGQLSAQKNAWKKVEQTSISQLEKIRTTSYSERQQLFQVDVNALKQVLTNASDRFSGNAGVVVEFPTIDGNIEKFQVWENSNFAPELQAQYPDIRAYSGKSLADNATINFSVSPAGVQTMVLRADSSSEFIEPYTKDNSVYVLFDSATRNTARLPFNCSTVDTALNEDILNNIGTDRSDNQSYKTMRLALSCTAEYTTFFGGTIAGALGGMNATMTRVNGILEKDVALHLNIIPNNNLIIYTNANTDPYSPAGTGSAGAWNLELQNNLTATIGSAAYDIGHLFGAAGGGGNAGCIGCVCVDPVGSSDEAKGSAFTSPSDNIPQGDFFDIDYVVHEMGHQLGANHTFSHNVEGSGVNVEPGSGSTIMGYAGITDYNVQENSDAYFTYRSILQMQTRLATKTCPVSVAIVNTPPSVAAPADFLVPAGTAYVLKGIVSDAEGDNLTYCWEQNNSAPGSQSGANSVASPTKVTGPVYRSFLPKTTPDRYLPEYSKVLAGNLSSMWESVSTVARTLKFTLTVRDNNPTGQQTSTDEVLISSSAPFNGASGVGPFQVTSQNATGIAWGAAGTTQMVTWDVNNTTTLPGSSNVNIKLSTDGGATWGFTLASNVANDGSEMITVPSTVPATNCRLLIEPTGNVYYAVNSTPFAIGYTVVNACNTYNFNTPFALTNGTSSYTVKSLSIPAGTISDVNIHVNATHSNLQNLNMAVVKPGGTLFNYFNQQCAGSANMDVTFDSDAAAFACGSPLAGTMGIPTGSLTSLNGVTPAGNWSFGFRDLVSGADSGTINSFWIEVCSQSLVPLGTEDFNFADFALYPNPNNGNFKVEFNSSSNNINIAVHDISGRKIFNKTFQNSGLFSEELQLSSAQAGIYLVTVSDGDKKIVKRIVVE